MQKAPIYYIINNVLSVGTGIQTLRGESSRTMSGGEPSSIKRLYLRDAVSLYLLTGG